MADQSIQDGPDPSIYPRHLSNANLSISQTTRGAASQFDSAAPFHEVRTFEMPLDSTSRSIPLLNNFPIRTNSRFLTSFPGDYSSHDLNYVNESGQQTWQFNDPSHQSLNNIISAHSSTTTDPWTSVVATGVPVKPVPDQRQQASRRRITTQSKHIDNHSDSVGDSGLGLDLSQYDTGSQMSIPVADMNPSYYLGPPLLESQDVEPEDEGVNILDNFEDEGEVEVEGEVEDEVQPESPMQTRVRRGAKKGEKLTCEDCNFTVKTLSDMKKHKARHVKKFKCGVENCSRGIDGFATVNDLNRHEKCVHKMDTRKTKSYRCFATGCAKTEKIWPRLDNFKQHLSRMHPNETTEDLLAESNRWYQRDHPPDPSDSQAVVEEIHKQERGANADRRKHKHDVRLNRTKDSGQTQQQPQAQPTPHFLNLHIPEPTIPMQNPNYLSPATPQRTSNQSHGVRRGQSTGGHAGIRFRQGPYSRTQQPQSAHFATPNLPPTMTRSVSDRPQQGSRRNTTTGINTFSDSTAQPLWEQPEHNAAPQEIAGTQSLVGHLEDVNSIMFRVEPIGKAHTVANPNEMQDYRVNMMFDPAPIIPAHNPELDIFDSQMLAQIGAANENTMQSSPVSGIQPHTPSIKINGQSDEILKDCQELIAQELRTFLDQLHDDHHGKGGMVTREEIQQHVRQAIKQSLTSRSSVGAMSDISSLTCPKAGKTHYKCSTCGVTKVHKSELTKHEKRHSRPYGCVLDNCYKNFGSKNDWKRHERTHPEQKECFRCDGNHCDTSGVRCYKVFYNGKENYQKHLREYRVSESSVDDITQRCRVRGNNNFCFWCGFCNKVVAHRSEGIEAFNKRLNHIDQHFQQEGKRVAVWIELAGEGKTKSEVQTQENETKMRQLQTQQRQVATEDDAGDSQESSTSSSSSPHDESASQQHQANHQTAQQVGQMMQRQLSHSSMTQQPMNQQPMWARSQQQQQQQSQHRRQQMNHHQQQMMMQQRAHQHQQQQQQQGHRIHRSSQSSQHSQYSDHQDPVSGPRTNARGQKLAQTLTCCQCEGQWSFAFGGKNCTMCGHWCGACTAE